MIEEINKDKIKKTAKNFFEKMGFDVDISITEKEDNMVFIDIKTDEPKILIGQKGQVLFDIQHVLKLIIKRNILNSPLGLEETEKEFFIDIDINNYKKKKIEYLKETANYIADEVALHKKEKEMEPMSSYERRIVHTEISKRGDVIKESIGEGENRRVVIKPKN